jgi:hypothetical protein
MAGQLTVDTLRASTGVLATQNGMTGIAKAWANWAGSTGTIASSFNVSSITRNSTGNYTVTFTTAMANANYSIAFGCGTATNTAGRAQVINAISTSSFTMINTVAYTNAAIDDTITTTTVFSS